MKRLISIVLSFVLILGMLPVIAILPAAEETSDSYTVVGENPTTLTSSDTGAKGVWYINGSTFSTTEGAANYIDIAAEGCDDAGALHVYQDNVANNDMSVGMFVDGQAAGTYTLKLNVKGDLGHLGQTCKFYPYGCFDQVANLHNTLGTTDVADWTEVTIENITVSSTFYYLIFSFSKYNWQTDMYIDNVRLLNASGTDVLGGAGNFYTLEEITCNSSVTGQWPMELDTSKVAESYTAYQGVWTPFCHYTAQNGSWQGTWPAWDATIENSNFGEIIASGYRDAGSLHLKSAASRNAGVAIDVGMTAGESYTLGLWVKGTASSNKMLSMYGNGDGTIIGNPEYCADAVVSAVPADWTYLEKTFTADRSHLILVAADWGTADLYIDNITLTDSNGNELMGDYGAFCHIPAELRTLNTETPVSAYDAPLGQWSIMYPAGSPNDSTWPAWDDTHYGEIVASGNQNDGALHLVSVPGKNAGVAIGADMVDGEVYTLGLWAKGTSDSGKVLFSYANGDPTIIGASSELTADWSYYEITLTCSTTQLNIVASDWGTTDIYIDNITLKNSAGTDLLAGYGNFLVEEIEEEPEEPTEPEAPAETVYEDPTEEGWIGRDAYTQLEFGVDYDYSFAVLGDIQHITDYTPSDLPYLFDYILDNKDSKNIQFVFGMGDSTNDLHNEANNLVEWQLVQEQFFRFNGVIPYTVIRGNHDKVTRMNDYLADPTKPGYTDQLDGFYQEGNVVNVWKEFQVDGVDYLSILIDYESSDSVLAWAADVIEAHPNHRVIVNTHVYMLEDGSYDNEMNPNFAEPGIVNNAQQVWDKLISQHENIFMVLCGHNSTDDVLIQHKTGVHGNQITEIRVDSQYTDLVYMTKDGNVRGGTENGVGMVTLLYFKNDGTQVAVEHYSTLRGWYREMQTFEIEPYEHYGWRYDASEADSYDVDVYTPATGLADAPAILQNGLGEYTVDAFVTENGLSYEGTGVSILPDYNMDLGTHTYALHSGTRTVEPSQTYTISYKIKGLSEAGRTWTQIHFCRSALGGSDTWDSQWGEGQVIQGPVSDWQTVSYDVTMDETTSAIEIYFIVNGSEMYVDDFSIVKKGDTENIVTNGDFELGTDGAYPTGFYTMKTGGIGTVEKVSGAGVDGSAAVRIEPRPGYVLKTEETLAVSANTEYTLSYMVRIPGKTTDLTPVIRLYDADGVMTELTGTSAKVSGVSDWTQVTYTFTTAGATASVQVCLLAYGSRVDVDNVSLVCGGSELITNGNFSSQMEGFAGEFVQGLQEGTVLCATSARPDSLIVNAKAGNGLLNAYDGETLLGTVDWLYGELEHKLSFGLYISNADTAAAVAAWVTQRFVENLWVISGDAALLDPVLAANENVRAVLDCTADSTAAADCGYAYVLVEPSADITGLKADGTGVIIYSDTVTEELLTSGADAILTGDSLAAIRTLEAIDAQEQAAEVKKWNLLLSDQIGANFYLQIDPAYTANGEVRVTVGGETTVIPVADLTAEEGLYLVSVTVAAAQMTDEISLKVVTGGILAENETYTIRQYADYILDENNGYDDVTKQIVREMLNYGSAAQTYFGYNTEALAGAGLTGVGAAEVPAEADTAMAEAGAVEGIGYYGASLLFQSRTAVRFYFTGEMTDCSVTVNGQALTPVQKDGTWCVDVPQISPDQLNAPVTVTVTKASQTLTVTYSPMNYIVRMSAKTHTSESLKALLKAMYNYHLASKTYKESIS